MTTTHAEPRRWSKEAIAAHLGVDLAAPPKPTRTRNCQAGTPSDLAAEPPPKPLPTGVQAALDSDDVTDRSAAHARVVGACIDDRLTLGQAISVCLEFAPSVAKYGDRVPEEVERCWSKFGPEREARARQDRESWARLGFDYDQLMARAAGTNGSATNGHSAHCAVPEPEAESSDEATDPDSAADGPTPRVRYVGPIPHQATFHGVLGDIVRRLEPTTEAAPIAMLAQLAAYTGGMLRDRAFTVIGGSAHPPRIWPLVIGPTSAGRKGESRAQVRNFLSRALNPPSHTSELFTDISTILKGYVVVEATGLSTGEGLLRATVVELPADENGGVEYFPIPEALVVTETEFARPLAAMKRDNNTLSGTMRDLWDFGSGQTMTKNSPLRVSGAFLVVIGHISPTELRLKLTESDVAGGLANRFLQVYSHRSRLIPDQVDPPDISDLAERYRKALDWSRTLRNKRVRRTEAANAYWAKVYEAIANQEPDGLIGELLARAAPYTMRLALLYALMDGCTEIRVEHIRAGLALVEYSIKSAVYVFGNAGDTGDRARLATALQKAGEQGLTKTDISKIFGRNRTSAEINALIAEMVKAKVVDLIEVPPEGRGRPSVRLVWIGTTGNPVDPISAALDLPDAEPASSSFSSFSSFNSSFVPKEPEPGLDHVGEAGDGSRYEKNEKNTSVELNEAHPAPGPVATNYEKTKKTN